MRRPIGYWHKLWEKLGFIRSKNAQTKFSMKYRGVFEALETRELLTTVIWHGGTGDTWSNAEGNTGWSPVPFQNGYDVVFNDSQAYKTINITGNVQPSSITFDEKDYTITGGSISAFNGNNLKITVDYGDRDLVREFRSSGDTLPNY
jgi:hypothetical protein